MKKSYSQFTHEDLEELGCKTIRGSLFSNIPNITPTDWLVTTLAINHKIPSDSEKAKSELFISPILTNITLQNPTKLTYFSGYQFNVDSKRGLKGFCDYLICQKYNAAFIESPLVAVVEAKYNQDLADAMPQCIAEMFAAQLFNERKQKTVKTIFGAVTNGYEWLFVKLEQDTATIDIERYGLNNLPQLLGVWQIIIDEFSQT
jgi:hypothetical protein